uniref:Homeobox domain-containing protein n=1 Tax=Anas platyrhynchos TaxID=8839 RepID=A0A8B9QZ70_ANAPL
MYVAPSGTPASTSTPKTTCRGLPSTRTSPATTMCRGLTATRTTGSPAAAWGSPYTPAKEDWHSYGTAAASSTANPGQFGFSPPDFNPMQPPGSGLLPPPISSSVPQLSPNAQRRTPYEWMRRSIPSTSNSGKTRTKDKYRVVYTDHQRLELEKEFHYSRYITIRRKAEAAAVKIWFQNRRAKERKVNKKKMQQQSQPTSTTTPTPPAVGTPGPMGALCGGSAPSLVSSSPLTIKEEFMP